jgi:hypothetical protein
MKEKPTVGPPFSRALSSDRNPKAMKDFKRAVLYLRLLNHVYQSGEFVKIIPAYSRKFCGYCVRENKTLHQVSSL